MKAKEVELQPYALDRISRDLPELHRKLGDLQPIVPLVKAGAEEFVVKLPSLAVKLRFRCPKQFQPLFYRDPGVHAATKVQHLLMQDFEAWLGYTRSASFV